MIGSCWIAKEGVILGTFAPNLPQIVFFKELFQSVRNIQTGAGVKLVVCRMVLRGQTSWVRVGTDGKDGQLYLIRNSIGVKVPPAEGRIPARVSQVNTYTFSGSGSILEIRRAQVLSHPAERLSVKFG
jgi:hypothetical protein